MTEPSVLLMPVDARWAKRFFGSAGVPLINREAHVHHTLFRPGLTFTVGQRLLWVQRAGLRRPARLLGGSVVTQVQVGRAAELVQPHISVRALPRQAITALANDPFEPLVALTCTLIFRCEEGQILDEVHVSPVSRHQTRPVRLGEREGTALWDKHSNGTVTDLSPDVPDVVGTRRYARQPPLTHADTRPS